MLKQLVNKSGEKALIILAPLIRKLIIRAIRKAEEKGYTLGRDFDEVKIANFIVDWLLFGGTDNKKTPLLMAALTTIDRL